MSVTYEEPRITITLPQDINRTSMESLKEQVLTVKHQHGASKLLDAIDGYIRAEQRAAACLVQVEKSIQVVNGIRTEAQRESDEKRSMRAIANRFYHSLDIDGLDRYCEVFHLQPNSYLTQDAKINALIEAHLAMVDRQND